MAEYYCVMKGKYGWWVTASDFKSELAAIVAANTGIRPPVGMRAEQASHVWRHRSTAVSPFGIVNFIERLEPRA